MSGINPTQSSPVSPVSHLAPPSTVKKPVESSSTLSVPERDPSVFQKAKMPSKDLTSPKVTEIVIGKAKEIGSEQIQENVDNLNRGFWSKLGRGIALSKFGKALGLDKFVTKMYGKARGGLQVPKDAVVTKVANPGKKMYFSRDTKIYPQLDDKGKPTGQPIEVKKGQHAIVTKLPGKSGMVKVELYEYNKDKELQLKETGFVQRRKLSHHWQKRTHTKLDKNLAIFPHQPKASDIGQGAIGNCFLLAGLGAMVERNPSIVESLIKDNGDGTVTVKMFDIVKDDKGKPILDENGKKQFKEKYIEMDKSVLDTRFAIRQHAKGQDTVPWVALLEKAYTIHLGSYALTNEGGHSKDVFEAFLGKEAQSIEVNPKNQNARNQMFDRFFKSDGMSEKDQARMIAFKRQFADEIKEVSKYGSTEEQFKKLLDKNEGIKVTAIAVKNFREDLRGSDVDAIQQNSAALTGKFMQAIANKTFESKEELAEALDQIDLSVLQNPEDQAKVRKMFLDLIPDSGLSQELKDKIIHRMEKSKVYETDGKVGSGEYSHKAQTLYAKLGKYEKEGRLMAFGTVSKVGEATGKGQSGGEEVSHGLVGGHAYHIIGVVELKPGDKGYPGPKDGPPLKFVQVRNPWNTHEGLEKVANVVGLAPDGGFTYKWNEESGQLERKAVNSGISLMELSEFSKYAEDIYIQ